MMKILHARMVANHVNRNQFHGFRDELRAAFHRLHMSADRGNKNDRALAQMLWVCAGTWDNKGDLHPVKDGMTALMASDL